MGNVIRLRQRHPYLRDIERLLETTVAEPEGTQLLYRCADRRTAGALSRWIRGEVRRRCWRVTVRQFRESVYVWKDLTPDEEEIVMARVGAAAAGLLPVGRPHLVPDQRRPED